MLKRMPSSSSLSPLVSLLVLVALLFAVFAIHSEATGHTMQTPVSPSESVGSEQDAVIVFTAVVAAPVVDVMSPGTPRGLLECALIALTCGLLLTLVVMVFLNRLPARYRRLLDAGGFRFRALCKKAFPVYRPSLVFLSISRV